MAGNVTKLTPSMLLFEVSANVEMVTLVVAAAAAAAFLSPANWHRTCPELAAGVVMTSFRVLASTNEAVPAARPVHVRPEVGPKPVAKLTPDTVTVLICVALAMVNDTVAVTGVTAITLLESTTDGNVSAALKMAGNVTDATVSIPALLAANVEMVTPVVAAAAAAAFLSPAN